METILYGLGLVLVPFIWIAVITGIVSIVRDLNIDSIGNTIGGTAGACENTARQALGSKQEHYRGLHDRRVSAGAGLTCNQRPSCAV